MGALGVRGSRRAPAMGASRAVVAVFASHAPADSPSFAAIEQAAGRFDARAKARAREGVRWAGVQMASCPLRLHCAARLGRRECARCPRREHGSCRRPLGVCVIAGSCIAGAWIVLGLAPALRARASRNPAQAAQSELAEDSARNPRAPSDPPRSLKRGSVHRYRRAGAEAGSIDHGVSEHPLHAEAGATECRVGGEQDDLAGAL
jgi:hypothetical protein